MKFLYWILVAAVVGTISWVYHPSFELSVGGTAIGVALTVLIIWSSSKLVGTKWWLARVALISLVAGLMNSTALDVLYSIFAAPAGGRFQIGIETVIGGIVLTALAFVWKLFRSQEEKDSGSGKTKR